MIAYDARGHGRSGWAQWYDFSLLVDDARRAVREVARGPVILVGHSLGALTALATAMHERELVRGLVLEEPPLGLLATPWEGPFFSGLRDALTLRDDPAAFRRSVARLPLLWPGPRGERTIGDVRGFYDVDRMASYYGALDPAFVAARLAGPDAPGDGIVQSVVQHARAPALLLVGDPKEGALTTEADVQRLSASLPDLTVKRFPRTGHRIHGLRPEPYLEALEPFLRRVRGAPPG